MNKQEMISAVESLYNLSLDEIKIKKNDALEVFYNFKKMLNSGDIRAAEKIDGRWHVNQWVKKGILLGFRIGNLSDMSIDGRFRFFDKDTYPLKNLVVKDNVRLVPGGSSIRDGCYVSPQTVIMPPAYINVGAYVDTGTLIDSHALVGSCAQLGKNIHLSAAAQIGGVLEPIGAMPVIIEDDVMIGGNCGIYEGTIVKTRAVIAAGVILTGGTPVYDLVTSSVYRKTKEEPLIIPEGAVVVAGTRPIVSNIFAREKNLSLYTPIIIKYRDEKTDVSTALEDMLR
ncbi:2,3,4,5-tetrahydropyridine-2,6-dicarboxylate N-succinyltransferase [bacterium]|nr:2,3,4,5-tetrahydropyridine-2,6-dicarboxylate N-succinyltransferase [bacterium]